MKKSLCTTNPHEVLGNRIAGRGGGGVTTPSNLDLVKVLITLIAVRSQLSVVFPFFGSIDYMPALNQSRTKSKSH